MKTVLRREVAVVTVSVAVQICMPDSAPAGQKERRKEYMLRCVAMIDAECLSLCHVVCTGHAE
jgi:hypothetical protein